VPDDPTPTHVLSKGAVRWAIETLGAQKLHPTFVMYLYLRKESRAGRLSSAAASSGEVESLIRMPGHPTKPFYFPLIDRGVRSGSPLPTFWRAENISGSWSPGSIYRQKRGGWMGVATGGYTLPGDHVERAFKDLLYEVPVSALALGCYFLRNDGFVLSDDPTPEHAIAGFRAKFDYPDDAEDEFDRLYTTDVPVADAGFSWFDPFTPDAPLEPLVTEEPGGV
jgi:hypothetical protein